MQQEPTVNSESTGVAPPFVSGGGGFEYEDRVAAFILAAMLAEQPPFGDELGIAIRVDWQTGVSGWQFDDLLLTLLRESNERRIAISCKSGRYVTGGGWPDESVSRVWEQWTRTTNNPFRKGSDILALMVGSIAQATKDAWERLLQEALVGDSMRYMQLYQGTGTSNQTSRNLVESLRCPEGLAGKVGDEPEQRFELIRHLRMWHRDLLTLDSGDFTRATEWCRMALSSGDRAEAGKLLQELILIASTLRPRSGRMTSRELVNILGSRFALKVAPSHESSWVTLDRHTNERQEDVRTTINDIVCFDRREIWPEILHASLPGTVVLLKGESGSGKSALAKRLCCSRRRVLWLSAKDFEDSTLAAVANQLGATAPLNTLLDEERSTNAILIIDGAERFGDVGRRLASRLVATAINGAQPWSVVITTQASGVAAVTTELGKQTEATGAVQTIEIPLPEEATVREVLAPLGIQLSSNASMSLLRALRNLKALDWVARTAKAQELRTFPDLVEQVWSGLLGTVDTRARAEVMKKLGKEEAARVVGGVPNSVFSSIEAQRVIEKMILDGLLRERMQRLYFRHDLLGDWARLLVLIESGESAGETLQEVQNSLRWRSAIRLFAQWLLQHGDTERDRLVSLIVTGPQDTVSVTLLEGCFRSSDCGPVVEVLLDNRSWATPATLAKFLNTFVSAATQPEAFLQGVSSAKPESATLRATFRVPIHDLWPSVAAAISARAGMLAKLAPFHLGELAGIWMKDNTILALRELTATNVACARIAVEAAKELQARIAESGYSHIGGNQKVFEAALFAATWLPDEVASLALELAARRPEPQAVKERVEAETRRRSREFVKSLAKLSPEELNRRQSFVSFGPSPRRKRKPFTDGPAKAVNSEFREAVFSVGVIVRLAVCRPAAAQEVLLACCLEDPEDDDPLYLDYFLGDQTGMVAQTGWYPPLNIRGPWLALLIHIPEQGLEAVMRLVSAGTTEWLRLQIPPTGHPEHDLAVRATTIRLTIDGTDRTYRGDHRVFGWYRGNGHVGNVIASALMALESWLYGIVDAKLPIDPVVKRLLAGSSSVAILGILAALARRHHELLDTSLRGIISSWVILMWDEQLCLQARLPSIDPFGLKALNNAFDDAAEHWSALPHRKILLPWLIAQKLALGQAEIMETCASARTLWQAELDSGACRSPESVTRLIALLDPSNLTIEVLPDGRKVVSVNWPEELAKEYDAESESSRAGITALQLRQFSRKLLDNPRALSDEQAESVWNAAASLHAPSPDEDVRTNRALIDARAGAAAVLENHAGGWMDRFPERRAWCESAALEAVSNRDTFDNFSHGMSDFKESGEGFAGAWAVARLASGDGRDVVRRVLAEATTAREYLASGQGLAAAVRLVASIPKELGRLFNLVWLWAALRSLTVGAWEKDSWEKQVSVVRRERLIQAYVQERIPTDLTPWVTIRMRAARVHKRFDRARRARHPEWSLLKPEAESPIPDTWEDFDDHGFNDNVLERIAEQLPFVVRPSLDPNLGHLVDFDRRLLDLAVWTMNRHFKRGGSRTHSDSLPGASGHITLRRTASIIAMHEDESYAMAVWRVLASHLALHHKWVEVFFDAWFGLSRDDDALLAQFHKRWRMMIDYTDSLPQWSKAEDRKWYDLVRARSALLGLHERGSRLGTAADRPFLIDMRERYATWARDYAVDSGRLGVFCYFLQMPGAVDLRFSALEWVRVGLMKLAEYGLTDRELNVEIIGLCSVVWHQQTDEILAKVNGHEALIAIIQHLAERQVPEAQELRADIEETLAQHPDSPSK